MKKNKLKTHLVSLSLLAEKICLRRRALPEYNPHAEQDLNILSRSSGAGPIPKKIWMYWAGDKLPEEIQCFVNKIVNENTDYTLTIINSENLRTFLPELVFSHQDMLVAHKSDVIRLELLYKYGGIWLDATIIMNQTLDALLAVNKNNIYDMIAFYSESSTIDPDYPVIETWFLAAPPNNAFIERWLYYFRPIITLGAPAFFNQLKQLPDYKTIVQDIKIPDYLILNITQQQALRENNPYNFYLRKCEANALLYQTLAGWRPVKLSRMLMVDRLPDALPPLTKLTGLDRKYLATNIKYGVVNKDSLLGQILFAGHHK